MAPKKKLVGHEQQAMAGNEVDLNTCGSSHQEGPAMVQLQCNKHFKSMLVKSAAQPGYVHRQWCPCCNAKQQQHWGHASQSKYKQTFTQKVLDKLAGVTYVMNSKTCMVGDMRLFR
jgi:hypothetical protein